MGEVIRIGEPTLEGLYHAHISAVVDWLGRNPRYFRHEDELSNDESDERTAFLAEHVHELVGPLTDEQVNRLLAENPVLEHRRLIESAYGETLKGYKREAIAQAITEIREQWLEEEGLI